MNTNRESRSGNGKTPSAGVANTAGTPSAPNGRTFGPRQWIVPLLALAAGYGVVALATHTQNPAAKPLTASTPAPTTTSQTPGTRSVDPKPQTNPAPKPNLAEKPTAAPPGEAPAGMVWVPGGTFLMGTDDPNALPRERPAHKVRVDGFWIDATEVTNSQFRAFVDATGYVTTAEKAPRWEDLKDQLPPGTPPPPPEDLVAGSMVFTPTEVAVPLDDFTQWWRYVPGANWKHPRGPDTTIEGKDDHPVVQVSWDDAQAYARWAGKRLPTEAEWERAARGGLEGKKYAWGDELQPDGHWMANIWQGPFVDTAPVKSFPPNGFGIYDASGNVWEWTADWYAEDTFRHDAQSLCENPVGPARSFDPAEPYAPKRVMRGGSFLCTDAYCSAYRTTGRMPSDPLTGLCHTGFRCARSPEKARSSPEP